MKILQVTNKVPYPVKDGGAIACMNLTRGFSLLGHKVTVLSMNTRKHFVEPDEIPDSIKDLAGFKLVPVPAHTSYVAALFNLFFSAKPYNAVRFISTDFKNELIRILQENEFDVVQLEGLYVCPYIPVIRANSNALVVYRSHNIEHEIWERAAEMSKGFTKIYLKNLAKRIRRFQISWLNTYDLLVPITERDGAILDELGNTKKRLVSQTGIDLSMLVPTSKNLEHPSLFHIGSLEWIPNQEGLLWFVDKCWPEIHKKNPDLKFYIAGRNAPKWLVGKFKQPNIVFLGEIADAYEFMNSKSIMVVPLFSGSGMRIKIIEGMALGKAIVTTPVGTEGISTTPGKDVLVAENKDDFIAAIEKLLNNKSFFMEIGKNAIEFIHENFDNLKASADLLEFYKQHC